MLGDAGEGRERFAGFRAAGGYGALPDPAALRAAVAAADLRGCGGAGFPTATKLTAVAQAPGPRVAVANGEEGEPASAKDRWLMRHRPHLVLDGLRAAVAAVDAARAVFYTSDPDSADAVRAALAEIPADLAPERWAPSVIEVAAAYVAGEETAVVRAIDGGEAKPLAKPPRPFQVGVGGRPTLLLNVETLARLGLIARGVAARSVLVTAIAGDRAALLELPAGATVAQALHEVSGNGTLRAVLVGGFAGGIWRPDQVHDAALSHDGLRTRGALLGCGTVLAVEQDDCPVAAASDVLSYLAGSSSGQCGICVRGTPASAALLREVCDGTATADTLALLARRAAALVKRGNCAMPDAAALLIQTLLANFAPEVDAHLVTRCGVCAVRVGETAGQTRFRVRLAV